MAAKLTIFPDTNVLIQGRSLHELPWEEIGRDHIELIICGPVIRELDRLKNRGGRVGRAARTMSSTVRRLMASSDRSDILRASGPLVTRRLLLGLAVREPVHPGIDLAHDDQAIMNQALARQAAGDDVILLSDDNFAVMTAEEFGLPSMIMPAHWLREPEADETARQIARKDAEIARLRSNEPVPRLRFVNAADETIERFEISLRRHLPLTAETIEELMRRIEGFAAVADVRPSASAFVEPEATTGPFDLARFATSADAPRPVTTDMIEKYRRSHATWLSSLRNRFEHLHRDLDERETWPSLRLLATNSGTRNATDVILELEASGPFQLCGTARDKVQRGGGPRLALDMPPPPPREQPRRFDAFDHAGLFGRHRGLDALSPPPFVQHFEPRREDDVFYWREGRTTPADVASLECRTWRHGRSETAFEFHLHARNDAPVAGLVKASIHAANLGKAQEKRLPIRITFDDVDLAKAAGSMVSQLEKRVVARDGPASPNIDSG